MPNPILHEGIGREWIEAFNAHDVPRLVALYAPDAVHSSPKLRARSPETEGLVRGTEAIGAWWRDAIARTPSLRYELVSATANHSRVIVEYVRHADGDAPLPVLELFEIREGLIVASKVFHG